MKPEEIVKMIQSGVDPADNMCLLWQQLFPLIRKIAKSYNVPAEVEDLCQQGYFGLYRSVMLWDPDEGTAFSTYSAYWIKSSMSNYLNDSAEIVRKPAYMRDMIRRYRRIKNQYYMRFGKDPGDQELTTLLRISQEQLEEVRSAAILENIESLDKPLFSDGESATVSYFVPDPVDLESQVVESEDIRELRECLESCLDTLPEEGRSIIHEHYLNERDIRDIAEERGLSAAECQKIKRKCLLQIRRGENRRQLKHYIDERRYSAGLRGTGVGTFNRTWTSATERAALESII